METIGENEVQLSPRISFLLGSEDVKHRKTKFSFQKLKSFYWDCDDAKKVQRRNCCLDNFDINKTESLTCMIFPWIAVSEIKFNKKLSFASNHRGSASRHV